MGEYIKISGVDTKLGTCEDLYYVRFEDLKKLQHDGQLRKQEGNTYKNFVDLSLKLCAPFVGNKEEILNKFGIKKQGAK